MISERDKRLFPYILPSVIFVSVFIGCLALGPYLFNVDGDLGRHLTLGGYILETGKIPIQDIFSQTMPGQPLSPHEWLATVIFRLSYNALGLSGVVLFSALLLGLVFWLITYRVYRLTRSSWITLILIILGIAGSRIHWLARPHIFTYLFLFLWIELLNSNLRFKYKWLASGGLMLVWVNTHGAFVTGYMVLALMVAGSILDGWRSRTWQVEIKRIQEYLILLLSGLLISLVNPSGAAIWQTILGFLGSRYLVSHTAEYQPPVLYQAGVIPFTLLVILAAGLIILTYRQMSFKKMLLLVGFAIFGIVSGRNIPLYILVSLPILAEGYANLLPRMRMSLDVQYDEGLSDQDPRSSINRLMWITCSSILLVCLGWGAFSALPAFSSRNRYLPEKFPVAAVDWLEAHPQNGNIFNDFMWGGYLLYREWPDQKVFIDGQTDFYGEALTRDYESLIGTYPGWQELVWKYQIDWVIIPTQSKLAQQLDALSSTWQELYRDETAVILRRQ